MFSISNKNYNRNIYGILFMLIDALAASILFVAIKILTKEITSNQAVFLYKLVVLLIILPWVLNKGIKHLYTQKLPLYFVSSIFGTTASLCLMHSFKHIPIGNVSALGCLEKVLLSIIGMTFFKEGISKTKLCTVIISFIGATLILEPTIFQGLGFVVPDKHYLFVAASIVLWVIHCVITKVLVRTESAKPQVFYTVLLSVLISLPAACINWMPYNLKGIALVYPSGLVDWRFLILKNDELLILILLAACYLIRSIASFKAMKHGDLSVIMPFGYAKIIFTGILGACLFNELPDAYDCVGYALLIGAGAYLAYSQQTKVRN